MITQNRQDHDKFQLAALSVAGSKESSTLEEHATTEEALILATSNMLALAFIVGLVIYYMPVGFSKDTDFKFPTQTEHQFIDKSKSTVLVELGKPDAQEPFPNLSSIIDNKPNHETLYYTAKPQVYYHFYEVVALELSKDNKVIKTKRYDRDPWVKLILVPVFFLILSAISIKENKIMKRLKDQHDQTQ